MLFSLGVLAFRLQLQDIGKRFAYQRTCSSDLFGGKRNGKETQEGQETYQD
jgi:hypothetical protein